MKNKAQAIEAIQNDCEIRHKYYEDGMTCAIGGLVLAADPTFDLKAIGLEANTRAIAYEIHTPAYGGDGPEETQNMRKLLEKYFGFHPKDLSIIQRINDRFENPEIRRDEIIKYIETIPEN